MKPAINKVSHAPVAETVARLIAEVEARGMKLFTTIDHGCGVRRVSRPDAETERMTPGSRCHGYQ
jgi:uncharacterized protein (DUF302 family)